MEFKGTEGTWKKITIDVVDYKQIRIVSDTKETVLAHLYLPNQAITEEEKANALLFSKSKQMLEMLNECREFMKKVQSPATPALFLSQAINDLIKEATEL